MSRTRSQKRRNNQQESSECVSEGLISPILVEKVCHLNHDVSIAGPSRPKSPRLENSFLKTLRAFLKEEITSEIKSLLVESQREMLKLLKPKTGENVGENIEEETENETSNFYTPKKSVGINSTQNDDPSVSRNTSDHCSLKRSAIQWLTVSSRRLQAEIQDSVKLSGSQFISGKIFCFRCLFWRVWYLTTQFAVYC